MSEWEPATDAEVAMRDALRTDDQESYFRILSGVDLLLPVSADALAGLAPLGWGTWSTGGRTHVLAFTSTAALQACLADYTGSARRVPYAELANSWPNLEWWLAVNPGLPIEGYLPAWFVAQLSRGDLRLPTRGPGREPSNVPEPHQPAPSASATGAGGPTHESTSEDEPVSPAGVRHPYGTGVASGVYGAPRGVGQPAGSPSADYGQVPPGYGPAMDPHGRAPAAVPAAYGYGRLPASSPGSGAGPAGAVPAPYGESPSSAGAGAAQSAPPSGRPGAVRPASTPPNAPSTSGPSTSGPPTSGPPTSAPPTSAPPSNAPPTSGPPTSGPPSNTPAMNAPVGYPTPPGAGAATPGGAGAEGQRQQVGPGGLPIRSPGAVLPSGLPARSPAPTVPPAYRPPMPPSGQPAAAGAIPPGRDQDALAGGRGSNQGGQGQDAHPPLPVRPSPGQQPSNPAPGNSDKSPVESARPASGDELPRRTPPPPPAEGVVGKAFPQGPASPHAAGWRGAERGGPQRGAEQSGADQRGADQRGADQRGADQRGADQRGAEQPGIERPGAEQGGAEQRASGPWATEQHGGRPTEVEPPRNERETAEPGDTGPTGMQQRAVVPREDRQQVPAPGFGTPLPRRQATSAADQASATSFPAFQTRPGGAPDPAGAATSPEPAAGHRPGVAPPVIPGTGGSDRATREGPVSPFEGRTGQAGAQWPEPDEEPFHAANTVEHDLQDAAEAKNTDRFLSTLLLATVLVPVGPHSRPGSAPGESGFEFRTEQMDGERYLIVFTSKDRLAEHYAEPTRTVGLRFYDLIRNWPDPAWSFAVNPGTPIGAKYPGPQVIALANWATEAGLGAEPERSIASEAVEPVPPPAPANDEAQHATVMQKAVPPQHVSYYLERGYDRVAGFVHRATEVEHLRTPKELFAALGLSYGGSPHQPDAQEAYVLRWPAYRPSLYRIPYGGQSEQALRAMDGWVIERAPFRGNGFAPGEGRDVVAEFKVDSVRLPHGAQLWRMDADGNERMIAIFDHDGPIWRPVGER